MSAPPNNENALTTGAYYLLAHKKPHPRYQWLVETMEAFQDAIVADLGGQSEISAMEMGIIRDVALSEGLIQLLARNILRRGLAKGTGEMRGPVNMLATFIARKREGLKALGLRRRAKIVPSLRTYLTEKGRGRKGRRGGQGENVSRVVEWSWGIFAAPE